MHSRPSPNCGARRSGLTPHIVVLHYTAMADAAAALDRLCDPSAEVSAHYLIDRWGEVTQMVDEKDRAWHAGAGEWRGLGDINSRSVGIELDNTGRHPFPEPQMAALEDLLTGILARHPIAPGDVIGHSDMAPGRKSDPGPRFDWARLARRGLAGPVVPPADMPRDFRTAARAAGFTADVDEKTLLTATRLRFAPWRQGPVCDADCRLWYDVGNAAR
ncbi:N-acetylmuramoyl-L-alanine amidase [Roseobacter ponti]|uniref:N-acetylmuramoyl-L-alanine amidase n=1 Tax=Roseobacter ponti TaxID=1891787 RepID=A0A858SNR1_9RHOB|nr:N-acetylmuramoyl-L-alanine amidase [Roseobacter ponti]QJF50444.1 N-acetylmuramoyl-L-alanine amidase [Roseobacter ponti]